MLKTIINRTLETLRTAEDTVCLERARLVTESYRATEGLHPAIRRARAIDAVFRNISIPLSDTEES